MWVGWDGIQKWDGMELDAEKTALSRLSIVMKVLIIKPYFYIFFIFNSDSICTVILYCYIYMDCYIGLLLLHVELYCYIVQDAQDPVTLNMILWEGLWDITYHNGYFF